MTNEYEEDEIQQIDSMELFFEQLWSEASFNTEISIEYETLALGLHASTRIAAFDSQYDEFLEALEEKYENVGRSEPTEETYALFSEGCRHRLRKYMDPDDYALLANPASIAAENLLGESALWFVAPATITNDPQLFERCFAPQPELALAAFQASGPAVQDSESIVELLLNKQDWSGKEVHRAASERLKPHIAAAISSTTPAQAFRASIDRAQLDSSIVASSTLTMRMKI